MTLQELDTPATDESGSDSEGGSSTSSFSSGSEQVIHLCPCLSVLSVCRVAIQGPDVFVESGSRFQDLVGSESALNIKIKITLARLINHMIIQDQYSKYPIY